MKKITAKVITISSQLLVAVLFLLLLFPSKDNNDEIVTVKNNNFDKKAEMTSILFEKENSELDDADDSVISPLDNEEDKKEEIKEESIVETKEVVTTNVTSLEKEAIDTVTGRLTGYAADCYGCSGVTSAGFDLRQSMYYEDYEYGTVRVLAADPSYPFYSIFRITGAHGMDPFIGIVLDRGGNVGFGRGTLFDLAFSGSESAINFATSDNVTFELLRSGK